MKTTIFLLAFLPFLLQAQTPIRCGTYEYWASLKQKDTSISAKELQINKNIRQWIVEHASPDVKLNSNTPIVIPVVVHVLWNAAIENIPDDAINAQIDVLNQDYSRTNADASHTPAVWQSIASATNFQFCFAKRKPDGTHTNGIERKYTTNTSWATSSDFKHATTGGLDVWNSNQYLNIWVVNFDAGGVLGFCPMPGGDSAEDGATVTYKAFGKYESYLLPQYNLGRTTTHEVGHWLGLYHPWGDDGGTCDGSDSVSDTPNQASETFGRPTFPKTDACSPASPGIMFMTYMDYTDDTCMNMFTDGQVARMNATMNVYRASIMTSNGCAPVGIDEIDLHNFVQLYPNPATDKVYIDIHFPQPANLEITLSNLLGEKLLIRKEENTITGTLLLDLSSFASGLYIVSLKTSDGSAVEKLALVR